MICLIITFLNCQENRKRGVNYVHCVYETLLSSLSLIDKEMWACYVFLCKVVLSRYYTGKGVYV